MAEALTLDRIRGALERVGATVEVVEGFLRVGIVVPTSRGSWGLVVLVESTSEGDLLAVAPGVAAVAQEEGVAPELTEVRAMRLANRWNATQLWPKLYVDDEPQADGSRLVVGECWVPFPSGVGDAELDQTIGIVMAEVRATVEALANDEETSPVALVEEPEPEPAFGPEPASEPRSAVALEDPVGLSYGSSIDGLTSAEAQGTSTQAPSPIGARGDLAVWLGLGEATSESENPTSAPGGPAGTWSLSDLVLGGALSGIGGIGAEEPLGNGALDGEAAREPVGRDEPAPPTPAPPTPAPPAPAPPTPDPSAPAPPTPDPPTPARERPIAWGQGGARTGFGAGTGVVDAQKTAEAQRRLDEAFQFKNELISVLESGDLVRGRAMLEQAVPLFSEVGLEPQARLFEVTLGEVCRDLGDLDAALSSIRRGWSWFHERRDIFEVDLARIEQTLAATLVVAGQLEEARTFFESARASYVRRALSEQAATCDRELGAIALRLSGFDEARQRFQAAQSRFERLGLLAESAGARLALGMACALQGDFTEAERAYSAAREAFVTLGDQANVAECDFGLGVVAIRTRRAMEAIAHYERARSALDALGRRLEVANCDRELAVAQLAVGDLDEARRRYDLARSAFASLGRDRDVAVCDEGLRAIAARAGTSV